jgi:hypothetical protein
MEQLGLIPVPDIIPAPAWLFLGLDLLTFALHILVINVVLGGSLILLFAKLKKEDMSLQESIGNKIPTSVALGVNFGVAPLLFMQVIYGNLFYSSSVLMATFWIMVIPLLILAYYGAYIHARKFADSAVMAKIAILFSSVFLLYIGFMFVNNMTLMVQPEKWATYFANRDGTILNLGDPTIWPRYLHFLVASIAIAGLFISIIWSLKSRSTQPGAEDKIKAGLKIFGIATIVQVLIGFWFLIALPSEFILQFMGRNIVFSIILLLGFLSAIGAIVTAFVNKLRPTVMMLLVTVILMVITRHNLRSLYLADKFSLDSLELAPQYGVMTLFFVILVIGLVSVGYMIKAALDAKEGRAA